jgi:hypothetical protein
MTTKIPLSMVASTARHLQAVLSPLNDPFNAAGDGTTDDTAAFTLLESSITGQRIDLLGHTYKVTAYPPKNTYFNGRFVLAKTTTINAVADAYSWYASAARPSVSWGAVNLFRDARTTRSGELFRLTQVQGLQGVAFDEVNNSGTGYIYTLHLTGSGASEVSYISQYSMAGASTTPKAALGVSNSNAQLGHQGLALEQRNNGTVKLWGPVRYEATNYPNGHRQVIRFSYGGNAAALASIEVYTLFGSEFAYTGNSVIPAISYCQRYLVALGRKSSRDFWIRVFDLAALAAGGAGDYSDKWLYEFNVDRDILLDDTAAAFRPVQGLACDGASIYVLSGNSGLTAKRIDRYSLDGRLEQSQSNISVGLTEATADGTFYEPEALAFIRPDFSAPPTLCMVVVSAGGGAHVNRVWALGYNVTIAEGRGTLASGRWTPTATAVTNVAASTTFSSHYSRIGNIVHFAGRINLDPTAAGYCELRLTPPIASTFASLTDASGTLCMTGVSGVVTTVDTGSIEADTANAALVLKWICSDTANRAFEFSGMYEVK